jgi:hypothetical protein
MTVGAVVVSRQPGNRIGWLCCAAGLLGVLAAFSGEYASYALGPRGGSVPGGLAMAWLNAWVGTLWVGLVLLFMPLVFPTGRLPSRRWRPVAWASTLWVMVSCVLDAVMPGRWRHPASPIRWGSTAPGKPWSGSTVLASSALWCCCCFVPARW